MGGLLNATTPDDATGWPVERLLDHIVEVHHAYVRAALPRITSELATILEAHGSRHPELARVAEHFGHLRDDFEQHLMKEEHVLFPYVRELAGRAGPCGLLRSPFGTVENPIHMMEREHADADRMLTNIRELTRGYASPEDGGSTYAACMADLREFERDFHRHVFLENDVLFPRAVELENRAVGNADVPASS